MNYQKQGKTIRKLRRMIPAMKCIQGCTDCCGPVMFTEWERDKIKNPKSEPLSIDCAYIADGGCGIYDNRPLICWLYGTTGERLRCPHGCRPDNMLTEAGVAVIYKTYKEMNPTL